MNRKTFLLAIFVGFMVSALFGDSFTVIHNKSEFRTIRYGCTWVDTNIPGAKKLLVMGVYNGLYILGSNNLDYMYLCTITLEQRENKNISKEKNNTKKINTKNEAIKYELVANWNGNPENCLVFKDKSESLDFKNHWNAYTRIQDNTVGFDVFDPKNCSEDSYFCRAQTYFNPAVNKTFLYLSGAFGEGKNAHIKCYEIEYEPFTRNDPGSPLKANLIRNSRYDIGTPDCYVFDMDVIDLAPSIADADGEFSKNHTVYPLLVMFARHRVNTDPVVGNCTDNYNRKCIAGDRILTYDGNLASRNAKEVLKAPYELDKTINDIASGLNGHHRGRSISGPGMLYLTKDGQLAYAFLLSRWDIYSNGMLSYGMWFHNILCTVPLSIKDLGGNCHDLCLGNEIKERAYTEYPDKGFVTPACVGPRATEFANYQILKLLDPNRLNFERKENDKGEIGWAPKIDIEEKIPNDTFKLKKIEYTSKPIYLSKSDLEEINRSKEIIPQITLPKLGSKDFIENYNPQYSIATIVYGWPYCRINRDETRFFPSINHNSSDSEFIDCENMKGTNGDAEAGFLTSNKLPGGVASWKFFIGGKGSWDVTWKDKMTDYKLDARSLEIDGSGSGVKAASYGKFGAVIFTKNEGDIFSICKLTPVSKSKSFKEPTPYISGSNDKKDKTRPVVLVSAARYEYPSGLSIMPFDATNPTFNVTRQKDYCVYTDGLGINDNSSKQIPERPSSFLSISPDDSKESIQKKMDQVYAWQKAVGFDQLFELVKIKDSGVQRVSIRDGKDGRWFRNNTNSADKQGYTMKKSLTKSNSKNTSGSGGVLSEASLEAAAGFRCKFYIGGKGGVSESKTTAKDSGITLKLVNDITAPNPFNSDVYRFVIDVTKYKNYLANSGKEITRPWFISKFAWMHNDKYYLIVPYLPPDAWNSANRI